MANCGQPNQENGLWQGLNSPKGFFCFIWHIRSDMEYIASYLHMESWSSIQCCPWCLAEQDRAHEKAASPWNDWKDNASWKGSLWPDHQTWLRAHGGVESVYPLCVLPGVTIFCLMVDCLPVVDLGVAKHAVGKCAILLALQ